MKAYRCLTNNSGYHLTIGKVYLVEKYVQSTYADTLGVTNKVKPGDYIQIKEVVDGIGLGYVDGRKHLLFNTKYLNNFLSTNFELMSEDFSPTKNIFTDVKIGAIWSSEDIVNQITELENQSFQGWSNDAIDGYLTACKTIKEKIK